jgi:hypothetical protein
MYVSLRLLEQRELHSEGSWYWVIASSPVWSSVYQTHVAIRNVAYYSYTRCRLIIPFRNQSILDIFDTVSTNRDQRLGRTVHWG